MLIVDRRYQHRINFDYNAFFYSPFEKQQDEAVAKLEELLGMDSESGARVYRTAGGLRYLFTHKPFEPGSEMTQKVMESLGADPLYVRLCKVQESFRARLTPKPWRCGLDALTVRFPRDDERQQARFENWKLQYEAETKDWATCRFVRHIGNEAMPPEIAEIVELHDRHTAATSGLPLA